MKNLIILDLGTTLIKYYYYNFKTSEIKLIFKEHISSLLTGQKSLFPFNEYDKLSILAGGGGEKGAIVLKQFQKKISNLVVLSVKDSIISINNYNNAELGIDRISVCNAVYNKDKCNDFIVVDVGTAITIDMVKMGDYKGGYILPGIKLVADCMKKEFTTFNMDINKFSFNSPISNKDEISSNTLESVSYGLNSSFFIGLSSIINDVKKNNSINSVFFTGGNGKELADYCGFNTYDSLLMVKGLLYMYKKRVAL